MMGESDLKSSPEHPRDPQWGSGPNSVADPVRESDQRRTGPLMETPARSVHSGVQLTDSLASCC